MSQALLKTDTASEIVLEAPRTAAWAMTVASAVAAVAVGLLLPGLRIAPVMLGFFALWALVGALRIHRLRLDLERGVYVYRRGFILTRPRRRGTFGEIAGVFIERNHPSGGLVASRLRSRLLALELEGWEEDEGRFILGFPMGPRIAADKAADYARRLGTEVVDRTEEADQDG